MKSEPVYFHLKELRQRLLVIFGILLVAWVLAWFFHSEILEVIKKPIKSFLTYTGGELVFTAPLERFFSYLKISFFTGVFASCPFWLFQVWKFIEPGLFKREKKGALFFVSLGSLLFLSGGALAFFVVFPLAFQFLLFFGGGAEIPLISLKEYLSFFFKITLSLGFLFQTPLFLMVLIKLNLITVEKLKAHRRHVILFLAILSAFFTPPDVISMFVMLSVLYLLFEISLFFGKRI